MRRAYQVLLAAMAAVVLVSVQTATAEDVPCYGVFEVTLEAKGNYANPYLKMPGDGKTPGFVVGIFTGPKDKTIRIDGFWDGGRTWKVRMAPTAVGKWRYRTISSDPGLNGKRGAFTCIPSKSRGFLRVDPKHPHHFMWDDGTPFYCAPGPPGVSISDPGESIDKFHRLLDIRKGQGFNFGCGYWGFCKPLFNRKKQVNEGGPVFLNYDPDRLNPKYHQCGDRRLKAALDRGFVGSIRLGWPDQGIVGKIGHPRLKRYLRYLIARYAAFNITYNLFGEVQEFGRDWLAIANDYGTLTKRWDPYDHLVSTHTVGSLSAAFCKQPWLDFLILQRPTKSTSDYLKYGKPVINAEYGGYDGAPAPHGADADTIRKKVWDVRMRGGYFVYESWGKDINSKGAEYSRLCNVFFRDRTRYWLLEYHPKLFADAPGLANPGSEYVVYLKTGGKMTVDLSAAEGTLPVEWFNPRTGRATTAKVTAGGANRSFEAPDRNDWVLHIFKRRPER